MILNTDSMKPLYVQIAEWLEGEILSENIKEEERIYSQYQLAEMFTIKSADLACLCPRRLSSLFLLSVEVRF